MKKLLLILTLTSGLLCAYTTFASSINFGCSGMNCFLAGVKDAGNAVGATGVVTGKGISQAVQDFIVYLLSFLSLIAVIYVMYAGAQMLLNPADEESTTKTKKIIIGVIGGVVIIWFAWWIVSTIFFIVNNGAKKAFIPRAIAETQIRNVDFTTYSNKIEALKTKLDAGYSPEVMSELSMLVDGAYDHMPDRADLYRNKQLYDAVKKAIADYNLNREIIDRGILQSALRNFLEQAKIYVLKSQPEATPRIGDAPLSVTLEAKQTIDESGTVIPNDNYIWWLRTEGGLKKILGKGNIINHTFETSGTYMVFLTVNSASKNSRGFNDVIGFEESIIVEVGQPKVQFVIRINDQIADKVIKISTKEALKPIRIDASETRFASGYTTKTTEWDFGNGTTDTNEGDPQFESQMYTPGDHTIRLKLIRNDGEEFSRTIMLKIGDPLASIASPTQTPAKGERVIFQAKKTSNEADVQYIWEVKKQGMDAILYTASGTRLEYIFSDTGRFFITLTSIKGDARDKDTVEVNIESRPPNVQFTSNMLSSEMPNVYTFDGSNSFDPDYPDNQKLRFEWFINDAPVQLAETNERNSRGKYTFPEKGTYRVALRVTDEEGKSKEFRRDIKITSILSAKLNMRPEVAKRGTKVLFSVTSPRATTYEWKVGGNDPVRTENNRFVTTFGTSGTFPVSVTVTNADGDTNTATGKIYVTEDDQPFSILDIKSDSPRALSEKSVCSGEEAITVDRANAVTFSSDRSVNKDGRNNDLTYFWKIGLNKTATQKNLSYTFDELGCEEIALTVSDKITGASHTSKAWVKVVNLAPIFNDIQVVVDNLDMDPMQVKLKILGAKDPDGLIRSYTWYYYTDRDDQAQGFRITRTPEASFVLPKITGRYYFAVLMEDSNGLKINTREVSDVPFSTPDLYVNTNLATPIIENFQADTQEVKFGDITRLSLDVRTPVSSDVSDKSEYRWDIDGDGFYDVKTTTPFYEFKYTYPGEYNPKVKVTHKGISATKSLTLVVKNSLVPKATVQIIGNKIVAYNTSSGLFQSANWYLDNKKISENKEYLLYDLEDSNATNLKLEISDGKETETVSYPIQPTLKNKVLLKKITRSLVVLSPLSGGDVIETPDEIVWEDPMTPLYIYLGESRGDIRYYVIDTDIDIDTDLSGGRDDDADNKGTASYRSGRPFQIPKGTKRVTIMKIRLVGNDNKDIDTRQIRITRKFLASTETDELIDTKTPQTFNLSQEDKDRIEKLRNLVQGSPEDERAEFNKILDQLGDNWYDVADRIQTLNLFSNTVNASRSLSPDLKKKILEQISIVYTQGDDEIEEKQLALKMITEYLAKSSKKAQIFGDSETPGLINEIIDNPEYYEANLKIIQKIMDDYVNPDTTLSPEVKTDIQEKLLLLAGSPPATAEPVEETSENSSLLKLLLWILGGVMCIILGIVGVIYTRQKLAASSQVPGKSESHTDSIATVDAHQIQSSASVEHPETQPTPDWLKEDSSPFGDDDVFSDTSSDTHQPDWLQDTVQPNTSPLTTDNTVEQNVSDVSAAPSTVVDAVSSEDNFSDVPDWLRGAPVIEEKTDTEPHIQALGEETIATPEHQERSGMTASVSSEALEIHQDPSTSQEILGDDVPDWLKGEESPIEPPVEISHTDEESDVQVSPILESHSEVTTENRHVADPLVDGSDLSGVQPEDDIPDWLRGVESENNQFPIHNEDVAESSSEVNEASVKEEISLKDGKKSKKETIEEQDDKLLHSPTHLVASSEDSLLDLPKKSKKSTVKKTVKSRLLLESEHDMLLPPQDTDRTQ